jgi:hypothetical protein
MLSVAFLHPALLWALPLCAVPIVIHLLNRRRFQRVPWAAMEFLLAALKRNKKRLRMEQWLVLLLRVLAVLLLVSLVSRPQLTGGAWLGSRTHHVVVLDDSASTTQRSGSASLFGKAQDRVRGLLAELARRRDGDLFSVVRASRPLQPDVWAQRIGQDGGRAIAGRFDPIVVGDGTVDLGQALAAAIERARQVGEASRTEYYLVGDRRAVDWTTADERPRPALAAALLSLDPEREHVTVVGAAGSPHNVAVADVRLVDRLAIAGVPASIAIEVHNLGLEPSSPTALAVEFDGQGRIVQTMPSLAAGERSTIVIGHTFHQAGHRRVEAALEANDTFALDDRRAFALPVRDRSRVLLVDGQPDEDLGEVFFVQAALAVPGSGVETQVIGEAMLGETVLDAFDAVWLCNLVAPSARDAERLEAFVAGGGGLVVTVGDQVDAQRYNELLWRDGQGPLPLPIGAIDGDQDRPESATLALPEHTVVAGTAELFDLLLPRITRIARWLRLEEPAGSSAKVVMRIRDAEGPPLLAVRPFGERGGEAALLAVTADRAFSNLPSTDLFLVLVHQLHKSLARRLDPSAINLTTDGVFRRVLDPGQHRPDVVLKALGGEDERTFTVGAAAARPEGTSPERPPELVVPMPDLRHVGAYEVLLSRHDGLVDHELFARQAPAVESRMLGFTETTFLRAYPPEVHERVRFTDDDGEALLDEGEGELWQVLALLLMAFLLLETLLAWRFGRR